MIASSRKSDCWPKMAVAFVQFLCRRVNLFQVEQLSLLTVMMKSCQIVLISPYKV